LPDAAKAMAELPLVIAMTQALTALQSHEGAIFVPSQSHQRVFSQFAACLEIFARSSLTHQVQLEFHFLKIQAPFAMPQTFHKES